MKRFLALSLMFVAAASFTLVGCSKKKDEGDKKCDTATEKCAPADDTKDKEGDAEKK